MWALLILLAALGMAAAGIHLFSASNASPDHYGADSMPPSETHRHAATSEACDTCAADGTGCYADRMLRHAVQEKPSYFNDEELDAFQGLSADSYSPSQSEQFAEVLHTLRSEEVADWLHSLSLRGIALPTSLRDEAVMLLQE